MMKRAFILFSMLLPIVIWAQDQTVWMHKNQGQWHNNVLYEVAFSGGKMYLEQDGFKYHFIETPHHHHGKDEMNHDHSNDNFRNAVVKSSFIGSSWLGEMQEMVPSQFYRNYFLSEDQSKWKSEVRSYQTVQYTNFYPQIHLRLSGKDGALKYSFIVAPGTLTDIIKWKIDGAKSVEKSINGELVITTELGQITESQPIAWTLSNGVKTMVPVRFKLQNNQVSYQFPQGYNSQDTLIIDPYLVFSTYTGATTDNWGMTATPGPNGEMYAGGITFGSGYPSTTGVFDNSYNGGTQNNNLVGFDVTISKFNDVGSQLMYSTYLGGSANELPESMIVNDQGELFVMGITASPNFPTTSGVYQTTFAGGPEATHNALKFMGSDLFIARFNAQGTQLVASTYLGGAHLDGLSISNLSFNYGDQYRGEIILQGSNLIIASHTRSFDFPVTNGSTLQGASDMVVCKLSNDLTSIIWSSYHGGSGEESGNSLALNSSGELFVTGGTSSMNFSSLTGVDPTYGGDRDGYILKVNSGTGAAITGAYMGDSEYDQSYFVSIDIDDNVYVFGQTRSNWPITAGKYGNPNSGQFIRKYNSALNQVLWTTMIGAGSGNPEISPTAFMISDCYDIMFTGWGGIVNNSGQAVGSSSNNFPITSDAHQSSTNGSNFYLGILGQDATNLVYGTYMGGLSSSSNHVDGGTSRFDKKGAVYHAVCASCGGLPNGFMSTPGVWSPTNPSPNCNLAAFKFQLGVPYSITVDSVTCTGSSTQLNATGAISYSWTPANSLNNPNIANPIASPSVTTMYYVTMNFSEGCDITDSVLVEVVQPPIPQLTSTTNVCLNDSIVISASGGLTYSWAPNSNISSTTDSVVTVWPTQSMFYVVTVGNECFETTDSIMVTVLPLPDIILVNDTIICVGQSTTIVPQGAMQPTWVPDPTLVAHSNGNAVVTPSVEQYYYVHGVDANGCENIDSVKISFYPEPTIVAGPDTSICIGTSTTLTASGATSYEWSPAATVNNQFSATPIVSPTEPTVYTVTGTYGSGCTTTATVNIGLLYLSSPIIADTFYSCYGEPKEITVDGADSYSWSPATNLNTTVGPSVIATVYNNITYTVSFTNVCGTVTADIEVISVSPFVEAFGDTSICPGQGTTIYAQGSAYYNWTPSATLYSPNEASTWAKPGSSTSYVVQGTDIHGCSMFDTVTVVVFPQPYIFASSDQYLLVGDEAYLSASTNSTGTISWTPPTHLSCPTCLSTTASPKVNYTYTVTITDLNGCVASDQVSIFFDPLIYVPNTFTPQDDEFNNYFKVIANNIDEFHLIIFDRWGERVFESYDVNVGWDGSYNDKTCQDGTYTWKLEYSDMYGKRAALHGHVNIVR